MTSKYYYLEKYVNSNSGENYFSKLDKQEIDSSRKKLGNMSIPNQLGEFYSEIGSGTLICGEKYPEMLVDSATNEILPPHIATDYMLGIIEHPDETSYYMSPSTYERLQPGDFPFFEIGDGSTYLIMKLNSDNPNAVWTLSGIKIEDSFERFIWRLYHESPDFYDRIIEDHYKNLESN